MAAYKNDYTQDEDYTLWELHEIRRKMASGKIDPIAINKNAEQIIKRYGLKNLKIMRPKKIN